MTTDLIALLQVVAIDITLAGDNAVVVGLAVIGLPAALQRRAILLGIIAATVIRIALSAVAIRLLSLLGLTLAGGLLLLWVCWKMVRELRQTGHDSPGTPVATRTLGQAVRQIVIADLSMSLDNVLAVAGAAREHVWIMVGGLALSVVLTGVAAGILARLLQRYRWIAWIGLAIMVYVSLDMILRGSQQLHGQLPAWVAPGLR